MMIMMVMASIISCYSLILCYLGKVEVVGSNPTWSISYCEGSTALNHA
jgi:hypothetical protein